MRYVLMPLEIVARGWMTILWILAAIICGALLLVLCPVAWALWRLWPAAPAPAPRRRRCPPCKVRLVRSWTGQSWWAFEQADRFELQPMTPRHFDCVSRN